jgi:phosphate/sulfate permease
MRGFSAHVSAHVSTSRPRVSLSKAPTVHHTTVTHVHHTVVHHVYHQVSYYHWYTPSVWFHPSLYHVAGISTGGSILGAIVGVGVLAGVATLVWRLLR